MDRDWTAIWMIGQFVFDCRQREGIFSGFLPHCEVRNGQVSLQLIPMALFQAICRRGHESFIYVHLGPKLRRTAVLHPLFLSSSRYFA